MIKHIFILLLILPVLACANDDDMAVGDGLVLHIDRWSGAHGTESVTVYDQSPEGNDGTLIGNAVIRNDGIEFDGTGDYVEVADTHVTNHTWIFWVNHDQLTAGSIYVYCGAVTGNEGNEHIVFRSQNAGKVWYGHCKSMGNYRFYETDAVVLQTSTWHCVAVTQSGVDVPTIYVDGGEEPSSLVGSGGVAGLPDSGVTGYTIGRNNFSGGSQYMDGLIGQGLHWNRVLSPTEITALYVNGLERHQ